jgi:UDP-N-acetylmuramoyl-tripeptide--D-alanyl-D-alanine ligase
LQLKFTIEDLFDMPTSEIFNPDSYHEAVSVTIDSRRVKKNSIFVAIKGEIFDGHKFVKEAVKSGAGAVVINKKKLKEFDSLNVPIITVANTVEAFGYLANLWRKKLGIKVISITGSSGKTSVKEMLYQLLSAKYSVCKTEANNNNHLGVPLTILSAKKNNDILLLEHGTNHFGEIEYTAKIAEPDYALITNIGSSHIEYLKNKNGVLKEKKSLLDETDGNGGKVFLNIDDKILARITGKFKNEIKFGFNDEADVKGKILSFDKYGYPRVEVTGKTKKLEVTLPLLGEASAKNFIAACSAAFSLSITKQQIINAVKKLKPFDKRLNVNRYKNYTLIDDTYNSNPDSLKSSIEAVNEISDRGRKILILGDMFELGENAIALHEGISKSINKKNIDAVYTIGKNMKNLNARLDVKKITNRHFRTRKSLGAFLKTMQLNDSAVLVKGSRGMKMEEFVKILAGKK